MSKTVSRKQLIWLGLGALLAAPAASCAIQDAYDDHARRECDQEASPNARGDCYDRVDRNSREHD